MAAGITHSLGNMNIEQANDYSGSSDGRSTAFEIKIAPGATVYRYDVEIVKSPEDKKKELTKQSDPGLRTAQRECCSDIIEALFKKTQGFGAGAKYVYDGKKILFTSKEIKIKQKTRITPNDLEQRAKIFVRGDEIDVTITPNERVPKLDYSDLQSSLIQDISIQADRSVRTFLEILTNQYLINTKEYQQVSAGCLFETRTIDLFDGVQMRVGFKKGVRIAGDVSNPTALMIVDMKRSAFFAKRKVVDIYNEFVKGPNDIGGKRHFENFMRDVRLVVSYDTSRNFPFKCLTYNPLSHQDYRVNGKSLPQFVAETKRINLRYPDHPGVHPNQPQFKRIVYPMELVEVMPGQIVPLEKLSTKVGRKLLAENSVAAKERYTYVKQQVGKIADGNAANFLREFGVKIDLNSNVLDIHWRPQPKLITGSRKVVARPDGSWHKDTLTTKFVLPSKGVKQWVVAHDPSLHQNVVQNFMKKLIDSAVASGMVIVPPSEYRQVSINQLEALFREAQGKYRFIFHIDVSNNRIDTHQRLKLYEAYYKVLTQQVLSDTMTGGPQTLKNIAMKLNAKTLGLCFVPEFDPSLRDFSLEHNDDLLVIGYDVSHPTKMDAKKKFELKKKHQDLDNIHPSVVGICANKMSAKCGFAGDFFYQQSRKEEVSPARLRAAVKSITEAFIKKGRTPKRVIVLRDGVSEGQYAMVHEMELPAIRQGILDAKQDADPKFTFIIATKDHFKRVFRHKNGEITSSGIGDIVDLTSNIVREDLIEMYVQSHTPLKGMAKMLQLTILRNDIGMSTSEIQKFIMTLSNMHQICACPTSLPLPIYLADETCKRGQNIYNELYQMRFPTQRNVQPSNFAIDKIQTCDGMFNFDQLSATLGYSDSHLSGFRFNA